MMKTFTVLLILCLLPRVHAAETFKGNRPQRYAAYKAHTILPESLRFLVKREGKRLFEGLYRGLAVPRERINDQLILVETKKITAMVNNRSPFAAVIGQMGYVSGLVATYTNPSLASRQKVVRQGFRFYLNTKLARCLFVFDGYAEQEQLGKGNSEAWLHAELTRARGISMDHLTLLEKRYTKVGKNYRHLFDERSAVFGVTSIYFSNLARLSAHLWYYAWSSAHGDVEKTPFQGLGK